MALDKFVLQWFGFSGVPASTVLYTTASNGSAQGPIKTFIQAYMAYNPPAIQITVPASGEIIDETTGKMTGVWGSGTVGTFTGGQAGSFSAATGVQVRWDTGRFQNGRNVRGRMFLCPTGSSNLGQGIWSSTMCNVINTAATTMISQMGGGLQVWSRPLYDYKTTPPTLVRPGHAYTVTTATTPTKPVILRSRRD